MRPLAGPRLKNTEISVRYRNLGHSGSLFQVSHSFEGLLRYFRFLDYGVPNDKTPGLKKWKFKRKSGLIHDVRFVRCATAASTAG